MEMEVRLKPNPSFFRLSIELPTSTSSSLVPFLESLFIYFQVEKNIVVSCFFVVVK